MVVVKGLIWDDWNKEHIAKHGVSVEEVEEVCHGSFKAAESYKKRILITGKAKKGKMLAIVLSPEDRNLEPYGNDTYYPITAFEKEVEK